MAASYLGGRQATARTVKETTSAATAPAMASSGREGQVSRAAQTVGERQPVAHEELS